MNLPILTLDNIKDKKVILRLDLDVKTEGQNIIDDFRLKAGLETLRFLSENAAYVIVVGHRGRPDPEKSIEDQRDLSMEPVANWFFQELNYPPYQKEQLFDFPAFSSNQKIILLENLRFYKGEKENDSEFAKKLANLGEVYVNDAFSDSHRNDASMVAVANFLPHFAGFNLVKELSTLEKVMHSSSRPLVVILGGAKLETKLPMATKMKDIADFILIGGEIATKRDELLKIQNSKNNILIGDLNIEKTDINDEDINKFLEIIKNAKTIIWNGPMGVVENEATKKGTEEIAKAIAFSNAFTVIGGGDSIAFVKSLGLLDKYSFVSTGGGAMIEFLSGKQLPAIDALLV